MPERSESALRGMHVHFDPLAGIAGDMTVAALVDAGVPARVVSDAVDAIGVRGLGVRFETRRRGAYVARGFVVEAKVEGARRKSAGKRAAERASTQARADEHSHDHGHSHDHEHSHGHDHEHSHGQSHDHAAGAAHDHRDYADIRRLLRRARLDPDARALAEEIFSRLAEVEAALHGVAVARVAFHEVGAFDSIADIVGAAAAIAWLRPTSISSSPPVVGTGAVRTAHGLVPVPAPATAALLRGIPMVADGAGELTTPTGAAILACVVDSFGPPPPMRLTAAGYGAGTRELGDRANVLRVMIGEPVGRASEPAAADVILLESNIDDMPAELLPALFDALLAAGAVDVWSAPIVMKKGRAAQQVSTLVEPARFEAVQRAFFLNSTTLGLRTMPLSRATLARSTAVVRTSYGEVRVKVAGLDGEAIGAKPEYEDCRRLASTAGVPVRRVWTDAVAAATVLVNGPNAGAAAAKASVAAKTVRARRAAATKRRRR